ncbi:MAG: ARMT1-like domain-containing protein [Thermodesulforhabdaceae bacterium]
MNLHDTKKLWKTSIPAFCVGCLERLVELTVKEATQDESIRKQASIAAYQVIQEFRAIPSITPAQIANHFHPIIKQICKNDDPFRLRKVKEMATARELVKKYPPKSDRLDDLIVYALMGNSIDFFRDPDELELSLQRVPRIACNNISSLVERIIKGDVSCIIVLADNAGEVYFDMPVLGSLVSRGLNIFYAVKAAPVQNDLSVEDLVREGLKDRLDEMGIRVISTGIDSVGLDYNRVSADFRNIYDRADVILAKGMGHFETLGKFQDERIFFLFEAKCPTVADTIGLSIGDFVACWKSSLDELMKWSR